VIQWATHQAYETQKAKRRGFCSKPNEMDPVELIDSTAAVGLCLDARPLPFLQCKKTMRNALSSIRSIFVFLSSLPHSFVLFSAQKPQNERFCVLCLSRYSYICGPMFSENLGVKKLRPDKDRLTNDELLGRRGPKIRLSINSGNLNHFLATRKPEIGATEWTIRTVDAGNLTKNASTFRGSK
jgi:hypothetical protein